MQIYTVTHVALNAKWIAFLLRSSDVEKKEKEKGQCSRVCKVLATELGRKYSFHSFELGDGRERQINTHRIGE